MIERILVPLDGSELAEQVLPPAEELARKFAAELILLRASTSAPAALRETLAPNMGTAQAEVAASVAAGRAGAEEQSAEAYLQAVQARLAATGLKVRTVVVKGGAARAILDQAKADNVSLIALASHGRGGLGRLVHGSVADEVLRHSQLPVLLVRPES